MLSISFFPQIFSFASKRESILPNRESIPLRAYCKHLLYMTVKNGGIDIKIIAQNVSISRLFCALEENLDPK